MTTPTLPLVAARCASPGRRSLLLGGLVALSGCGFHLRRPEMLPFTRIALSGFSDRSTMAEEIRRALPRDVTITEDVTQAQVVVDVIEDLRETRVEASTAFGQVRELRLHARLRYRVLRPNGEVLFKENALERERDLTYNEASALAKDTETNVLYREMQSDIAVQLMRVLAAVGK